MKICFATHNQNKLKEIQAAIPNVSVVDLSEIGCTEEIPETGATLEENSIIKAKHVFDNYNINCFADDTGLEVEALNGEPGVYSARYAGKPSNSEANIDLLLKKMENQSNRKARFRTVITFIENGVEKQFEGIVNGKISTSRIGEKGFGYDPIFIPNGYETSFAEMTMEEKNKISHRGLAVKQLIEYLSENNP